MSRTTAPLAGDLRRHLARERRLGLAIDGGRIARAGKSTSAFRPKRFGRSRAESRGSRPSRSALIPGVNERAVPREHGGLGDDVERVAAMDLGDRDHPMLDRIGRFWRTMVCMAVTIWAAPIKGSRQRMGRRGVTALAPSR